MIQKLGRLLARMLLLLVVAIAAGYGALRAYLWYETDEVTDRIAAELSPFVRLDWQSADSSIPGELVIHGLEVRPASGTGLAFIERLEITSSELSGPRALLRRIRAHELPPAIEFTATGVRIDSDDPLLDRLDRLLGGASLGTPLAAAGCPDTAGFSGEVLQAVGQDTLRGHASLRLRRHRESGRTALLLDAEFRNVAALTVEGVLTTPSPALTSLRLRYTDRGFNASRNHYCAARADTPVAAFVDHHMAAVAERYHQLNAPLSATAKTRYRAFVRQGGDLLIDLSPRKAIPLRATNSDGPGLMAALAPGAASVSINGRPVDLAIASWIPAAKAPEATPAASRNSKARGGPRFESVAMEALGQHVGKLVRLRTRDGQTHSGRLEGVKEGRIAVSRSIAGGQMRYTLPEQAVQRVEVRR